MNRYFACHLVLAAIAAFFVSACAEDADTIAAQQPEADAVSTKQSTDRLAGGQVISPALAPESAAGSKERAGPTAMYPPRVEAHYLPTESRFLRGESLSSKAVKSALGSDDFDEIALAFERDMSADRNAQDLTQIYRENIKEQLGQQANLITFVCGTSLCMGSIISGGSNEPYLAWKERFFQSESTPSYVFTDMTFDYGQDSYENRFFFSNDPDSDGIRIPRGG